MSEVYVMSKEQYEKLSDHIIKALQGCWRNNFGIVQDRIGEADSLLAIIGHQRGEQP